MTVIYTTGSASEAHIWNLTLDDGPDRKTVVFDPSSNARTLKIASPPEADGSAWSAIITGQFQYQNGNNTLGGVTGLMTQIDQYKNGALYTITSFGSPADARLFIGTSNPAAFMYERQLLNQGVNAFGSTIQNHPDSVWGAGGNDFFTGYGDLSAPNHGFGKDWFFGDGGIDTAIYRGSLNEYSFTASSAIPDYRSSNNLASLNGVVITDTNPDRDGSDYLISVERLQFADTMLALDIAPNQTAGKVYMLYQATFNRTPDAEGLGYWIKQVDNGANITTDVAAFFVTSPEFVTKYGANPSIASYVDNLYLNVLGRPGEAGGVAYWNKELNAGTITRAAVLEAFATLPEGAALVADAIANGIQYQEWLG